MGKRILIIAGETSGDLHGSILVREMKKQFESCCKSEKIHFTGIGGDRMVDEGVNLLYHIRDVSFMGFWEVCRHFIFLRRIFLNVVKKVSELKPNLAILIDYPGFNLRLAARLKEMNVPVFYYISPQIWAWKRGRLHNMTHLVDRIAVFFRFEEELYKAKRIPVACFGHPLIDIVKPAEERMTFRQRHGIKDGTSFVAILPGSREQEVLKILPTMLKSFDLLSKEKPDLKAIIGKSVELEESIYTSLIGDRDVTLLSGATYDIMSHADLVWVASGTATLETAILGTPMIVVYKTSLITYILARMLVNIRIIALTNIVAGKKIVPELIQNKAEPERLTFLSKNILDSPGRSEYMKAELMKIKQKLGEPGVAERVARWALEMM